MAADNVGIEFKKKRVISKQTLRDNPNLLDCSIEHYYCVTVFLLTVCRLLFNAID